MGLELCKLLDSLSRLTLAIAGDRSAYSGSCWRVFPNEVWMISVATVAIRARAAATPRVAKVLDQRFNAWQPDRSPCTAYATRRPTRPADRKGRGAGLRLEQLGGFRPGHADRGHAFPA